MPYGFAHFGKSLFWCASEVLFAFFLTEVCHLSPWTMAVILSASIAVNAGADTLVGTVLARSIAKLEGAVRMQTWGAIVSGLCIIAFLASGLAPNAIRLPYAVTSLMLFRVAYALYDVPQNVILAIAGRSANDRSTLSALRISGSGIANLLMSVVLVPLLAGKSHSVEALNATGIAIAMTACAVLTSIWLRVSGKRQTEIEDLHSEPTLSATYIPMTVIALLAANLLFASGTAFFTRLEPYFATYGVQSRLTGASVMAIIAGSGLAAQPVFAFLARCLPTWKLLTVSSLIQIGGCAALYLALMWSGATGVVPASAIYGFGAGGTTMLSWVALTDVVSRAGLSPPRAFGMFTFASKLGLALSTFLLGNVLARGDYHAAWQGNGPLLSMMTFSPFTGGLAYLIFGLVCKPGTQDESATAK